MNEWGELTDAAIAIIMILFYAFIRWAKDLWWR